MKILLFSDIHIHNHSHSIEKLHCCLECLEWVYKSALERNIKHVIFAGDLFHDRQKINIYAYHKTYEILEKYSDKIKSYFILGNHDMHFRNNRSVFSIIAFSKVINVISEPQTIDIEGFKIDCLSYTENLAVDVNNFKKSDLLIGHLSVAEAVLNSKYNTKYEYDELIEKINDFDSNYLKTYKKVFLGHFHLRQQIDSHIEYIGSPLQLSYGEAMDPKGFIIFDTDDYSVEFVENDFSPKYIICPLGDDLNEYDLQGNYVRVIAPSLVSFNPVEFRHQISEQYKPRSIEIINKISKEDDLQVSNEIDKIDFIASNTAEVVQQYIKSLEIDLDKDMLIKIGMEIVQKEETLDAV